MHPFQDRHDLQEETFGARALAALTAWITPMDERSLTLLCEPVLDIVSLEKAYPRAASRRDQLLNWLGVVESTTWDPDWLSIGLRISSFAGLLEQGLLRPMGDADYAAFHRALALRPIDPALIRMTSGAIVADQARWSALRAELAALRGSALTETRLYFAGMPSDAVLPELFIERPEGRIGDDHPQTEDPASALLAFLKDGTEDERASLLWLLDMNFPPRSLPVETFSEDFLETWLKGADLAPGPTVRTACFNRILFLIRHVQKSVAVHYEEARLDEEEREALDLQTGIKKIADLYPPDSRLDPQDLAERERHHLERLRQIPAEREIARRRGPAWASLLSGPLSVDFLRAWATAPANGC